MFSFHRPKVYRSPTGCCICKAKSSRFTDSKKYEEDFLECFKLVTPRQGEICNACVLLVKRWKKLPIGSERNWQHVVDARAGPGMKSFTKFKTKNKKLLGDKVGDKMKKKHFVREYSPALSDKSDAQEDMDINDVDFLSEEGPSMDSSRTGSPGASDNEDSMMQKSRSRRRKAISRRRKETQESVSGFIDLDYWKRETICCGTIFRGQNDEVMVDPSYIKPCLGRIAMCKAKAVSRGSPSSSTDAPTKGVYSDSSSDSGYDDYSNQGMVMSPENALEQGNAVTERANPVHVQGNVVIRQGNVVNASATLVSVQGNLVNTQGNLVNAQGNIVIAQGNLVNAQGNLVIAQGNLVKPQGNAVMEPGNQENLVDRHVSDLRCHETMFKRHETLREVQLGSGMVLGSKLAVCYNEAKQTVVRN